MEKGYKKLFVWQKADDLAYQVYLVTKGFPKDEIYGLTSQLRRSAISIPTNIVEASGRQNKNEVKQFINVALGSLAEVEYLLEFCYHLNYISEDSYKKLEVKPSLGWWLRYYINYYTGVVLWRVPLLARIAKTELIFTVPVPKLQSVAVTLRLVMFAIVTLT